MTPRVLSSLVLAAVFGISAVPAQEPVQEAIPNWSAPPLWSWSGAAPGRTPAGPVEATDARAGPPAVHPESLAAVPTPPLTLVGINPCRIADTRDGTRPAGYGPPSLPGGGPRNFTLTGQCGIAGTAQAVSLNITVVNTLGDGFLLIFPQGGAQPVVSTLNYVGGQTVANAAVVPLGTGGGVTVIPGVSGFDLILDTNGYYAPQTLVSTLNTLSGDVTLAAGTDLSLTPSAQTLTLSANSASANTANTLVRRDGSGNFSAQTVTLGGNLALPATSSTAGVITSGGSRLLHSFGTSNTFVGLNAGNFTMTGAFNTASGLRALSSNTIGAFNTASGVDALFSNTTGTSNTASGVSALFSNTTGNDNTASGVNALKSNTTGFQNTASGVNALFSNTIGVNNTASGVNALFSNTTGGSNTASGFQALQSNTSGGSNIAIGFNAGSSLTTGSNNIDIGSVGVAAESNTIRIGTVGTQTATLIAGISGATSAGGVGVFVNAGGQLGTMTSSRRFKEDIREIAEESDGLMRLRPVTFRYKPEIDPEGLAQYGLIAEEVAQVYPDLVVYDRDGKPETVRYHLVNALLLNEVQKQHRTIEEQNKTIQKLSARLARVETQLAPPGER